MQTLGPMNESNFNLESKRAMQTVLRREEISERDRMHLAFLFDQEDRHKQYLPTSLLL